MSDPTPAQKIHEEILRECEKINNGPTPIRKHITHFHDCGCLSQKYKEVIKDLLEALKAQMQMRDTSRPRKLVEEMAWVENDELANKMAREAIQKAQKLQPRGE